MTSLARRLALLAAGTAIAVSQPAAAQQREGEAEFRSIYRELVETDTSITTGSCTLAAERMAQRLHAAGYPAADVRVVVDPGHPAQGNLVARIPGTDPKLPAVLLLAHIDVVAAKASDWKRDPYKLVEEDGYFFARGVIDDKAMAAIFVDTFLRFRAARFRPKRTIKLALTCGEEVEIPFNGVRYLLDHDPDAVRAGWAINEGGKGSLDDAGKPVSFGVQIGEKTYQDYTLTTASPGGHSARPTDDNAIGRLGRALARVDAYRFPINPIPGVRAFFASSAHLYQGQVAADMAAIGDGTADAAALGRIAQADRYWNAYLRTTCIPTLVKGGHSINAQPQHADANINCRILPGETVEQVRDRLVSVIDDPAVEVAYAAPPEAPPGAPPLDTRVLDPVERLVAKMWPGVPVIPTLSTGATDGRRLTAAGIPTYGISGLFVDPDGSGIHGLDERVRVKSVLDARDFLHALVTVYAEGRRK